MPTPSTSRSICRGFGQKFGGIRCEYLLAGTVRDICTLLKERNIADICRKGRCTFAVMDMTLEKMSQWLPSLLDGEDLDLAKVFSRLERRCSEKSLTIGEWFDEAGLMFRNSSIELVRRRGVTPSTKNCGACNRLTRTNPFLCLISGTPRLKGDPICEEYSPFRVGFEPVTDESPLDSFLKEESITKAAENERRDLERRFVESIEYALRARALRTEPNTAVRRIYTRQYNLFVILRHIFRTVDSLTEAVSILARQLGVSERAVRRDLGEIREFAKKRGI